MMRSATLTCTPSPSSELPGHWTHFKVGKAAAPQTVPCGTPQLTEQLPSQRVDVNNNEHWLEFEQATIKRKGSF